MLMNDVYKINYIKRWASRCSCKIAFNIDHDIFKVYPEAEVKVPRVLMVVMIKELLELQMGQQLWMCNTGELRFYSLSHPPCSLY